ncbi:diacylglycerol kinase [Dehalococcoides mccartyi]|nr:diacylglycerol kinase [Dehalococcoides mccartyi]
MNRLLSLLNPAKLLAAFGNSLSGLATAIKSERAFQQEIILLVVGSIAAFVFTDTNIERAILVGSLGIVLIVEILNSAIEATIDRIGTEHNLLSKQAKDLGSAAVLLSLATAAAIWLIILL